MIEDALSIPREISDELSHITLELQSIASPTPAQDIRMTKIQSDISALRMSLASFPRVIDTVNALHVCAMSDAIRAQLEQLWARHLDILEESPEETRRIYLADVTRMWTGMQSGENTLDVVTASDYQFSFSENTVIVPASTRIRIRYENASSLIVGLPGGVYLHTDPSHFPKNGILVCSGAVDAHSED